jgi:hypothetical protein
MATETRDELALRLLGDVAELCRAAGATVGRMDTVYNIRSWPEIQAYHGSHVKGAYSTPRPDPGLLPGKVADVGIAISALARDLDLDLASEMVARLNELKKRGADEIVRQD